MKTQLFTSYFFGSALEKRRVQLGSPDFKPGEYKAPTEVSMEELDKTRDYEYNKVALEVKKGEKKLDENVILTKVVNHYKENGNQNANIGDVKKQIDNGNQNVLDVYNKFKAESPISSNEKLDYQKATATKHGMDMSNPRESKNNIPTFTNLPKTFTDQYPNLTEEIFNNSNGYQQAYQEFLNSTTNTPTPYPLTGTSAESSYDRYNDPEVNKDTYSDADLLSFAMKKYPGNQSGWKGLIANDRTAAIARLESEGLLESKAESIKLQTNKQLTKKIQEKFIDDDTFKSIAKSFDIDPKNISVYENKSLFIPLGFYDPENLEDAGTDKNSAPKVTIINSPVAFSIDGFDVPAGVSLFHPERGSQPVQINKSTNVNISEIFTLPELVAYKNKPGSSSMDTFDKDTEIQAIKTDFEQKLNTAEQNDVMTLLDISDINNLSKQQVMIIEGILLGITDEVTPKQSINHFKNNALENLKTDAVNRTTELLGEIVITDTIDQGFLDTTAKEFQSSRIKGSPTLDLSTGDITQDENNNIIINISSGGKYKGQSYKILIPSTGDDAGKMFIDTKGAANFSDTGSMNKITELTAQAVDDALNTPE